MEKRYPKNIKQLMLDRTQADLAGHLGVSPMAVNFWVSGRNMPDSWKILPFIDWLSEPHGRRLSWGDIWLEVPTTRVAKKSYSVVMARE